MRFYGNGVVYSNGKLLVRFEKPKNKRNPDGSNAIGYVDVQESSIKNKLINLGYKYDAEPEAEKVEKVVAPGPVKSPEELEKPKRGKKNENSED